MTCDWLDGQVVVIIGGTSGLGASAARACVAAGASVVVVGRDREKIQQIETELGDRCAAVAGDARSSDTAELAIATAQTQFGRFHSLYHVAGGSGRRYGDGPLEQITDEGIEYVIDLNLKSLLYSNRAAVRAFLKAGASGTILNMGSVLGEFPSSPFFATHVYATAKAAIVGLTKSAAAHYADRNIRFNVIAPALVETPMAQRAADDEQTMEYVRSKQKLDGGRIGQPSDLDAAVVYLLSPQASFVTGQTFYVDGGWSVCEGQL